jgi:hypothetical protein
MTDAQSVEAVLSIGDFPLDGSVKSLGWGIAIWMQTYLIQADGETAGDPFKLTREQLNFLLWFYAVDDRGHFTYRRATLRRSKGWGKSPFLAAIALAELCGPVRFSHFAGDAVIGEQHPMPWVVVAGIALVQTENTMAAIRGMASGQLFYDTYGLDENSIGKTRIILPSGAKIVPITASSRAQEGARPTFAIMDETHHWTDSNGGAALARVIRRNLAKTDSRAIETTNAHAPGENSVAEKSYIAWLDQKAGKTLDEAILYDSREAPGDIDLSDPARVRLGLIAAYGDATWAPIDRLVGEVYDPGTTPEESRRFYLNQIVASADSWVAPHEWESNIKPDMPGLVFGDPQVNRGWKRGDTVALGFDGSLTDDSTALVATRIDDGAAFLLAVWEKPEGPAGNGWEVPKDKVRDIVDYAFAALDVVAFFADMAFWETDTDLWRDAYSERLLVKATTRHSVQWDMRGHQLDTTRGVETLHRAIVDHEVPWRPHDLLNQPTVRGDEVLKRHVLNGRRRLNRWGTYFGKESRESPKKVDALAALVLSRMARSRILAEGKLRRRSTGRVAGF